MIDWGQLNDRLEHGKQQRRRRRRRLPVNHDNNTKNIIITSKDTKKSKRNVLPSKLKCCLPKNSNVTLAPIFEIKVQIEF